MSASFVATTRWSDALAAHPGRALVAALCFVVVVVGAVLALRRGTARLSSLRAQLLVLSLTAVGVAGVASVALWWVMVLDGGEVMTVAGVLGLTAVVAVVLVVAASAPLGRDLNALEAAVRRLEAGDRELAVGLDRRDELGHVAHALDELTVRLRTLERERAQVAAERQALLGDISHDLRTPLAALRVAVEALADGVAPDPDRYVRSMLRDVEALSALVDDLFLLVRIESGAQPLTRQPVDLTEVVDEAVEALAPVAHEHGVQLHLDAGARVHVQGHAASLGRVVRNLIDNAVRHAPAGSTVDVQVVAGDPAVVRVRDAGPGFPDGFASRAFDRFSRPDAARTRVDGGGAGLGLAIAREVVEAHGGTIWIEDVPDGPGAEVAFALPG